jgi:hypothetical protein
MTVTAMALNSRRGTILPLDQRRRDALAEYAFHAALAAGVPLQTWVRTTWGLAVYEAKDLIRGNASEAVWERILKGRGPHCGWSVAIPVLGAVIGEDLAEHFASERERIADERARHAAREAHVAALEAHARNSHSARRLGAGEAAVQGRRAPGEPGLAAARVGRRAPR